LILKCISISSEFSVPNDDLVTIQTLPAQLVSHKEYKGRHVDADAALKELLKELEASDEWSHVEDLPFREMVTNAASDGIDFSSCVVEYLVPIVKK
jgi:hypothetical protein